MRNHRSLAVLGALILALSAVLVPVHAAAPPVVSAAAPAVIPNDLDAILTVTGTNLTGVTAVTLGGVALVDVEVASDTELTAVVPWGRLDPGVYPLAATGPGGKGVRQNAVTVQDGFDQWRSSGPFGGDVIQILQNPAAPAELYVNVREAGVFRSQDRGASWEFVFSTGSSLGNLAMDAVDPSILYAARAYQGLFRSQDGGDTWEPIPFDGIERIYAVRAFPDPAVTGRVFAALNYSDRQAECAGACGIYRSDDFGDTWEHVSAAGIPDDKQVMAMAFQPGLIYAGASDGVVYRSADGGDSWVEMIEFDLYNVAGLVAHPTSPGVLYVLTGVGDFPGLLVRCVEVESDGIYYLSCAAVEIGGASLSVSSLQFNPSDPSDVLAATANNPARSTDGGVNWAVYNDLSSPGQPSAASYDAGDPDTIFAGSAWGFFSTGQANQIDLISSIYTGVWEKKVAGLTGLIPSYLAASPAEPEVVYLNTDGSGLFRSQDGGASWEDLPDFDSGGMPYTIDGPIAADPQDAQKLLIGTGQDTVFISADGGLSWTESSLLPTPETIPGATAVRFFALEPDPGAPGEYLAGVYFLNWMDPGDSTATGGGIYRSSNGGMDWNLLFADPELGPVQALAFDPADPGAIYAGSYTVDADGFPVHAALATSADGGSAWDVLTPEDAAFASYTEITSLTVRPSDGALFASSGTGVLRIDPETNAWEIAASLPLETCPIRQVLYVPALVAAPETLYAAACQGLYASTDGGSNWTYSDDALAGASVTVLEYVGDSGARGLLYGGAAGGLRASAPSSAARFQSPPPISTEDLIPAGVYHLTRLPQPFTLRFPFIRR